MSDKWYEFKPLSNLIESLTKALNRGEVNDVIDTSLRLMRDHTIRKDTTSDAVGDLEKTAEEIIQLRERLHKSISNSSDAVPTGLPTESQIMSLSVEEVSKFKKKLSQANSACDKRLEKK